MVLSPWQLEVKHYERMLVIVWLDLDLEWVWNLKGTDPLLKKVFIIEPRAQKFVTEY